MGVVVHVLNGYCVVLNDLLVEFLQCLEVGLLLCFGVAQVSDFFVVFAFLERCFRVDVDVYPVFEDGNTDGGISAVAAFACYFGQEDYDVGVDLLEMRIVLPYFLLMDQVDQPGLLVLVDLFEQIVNVQPQSAWVRQHIG